MSSVVAIASATDTDIPNERVALSATKGPVDAAGTTSPPQNVATQETDSVTGTLSDTPSAQSTTNPPAAAPTPSAQGPEPVRPARQSASTTSSTSPTSPVINDAPPSPAEPSTDVFTQTTLTPPLAQNSATSPALDSANQSSGPSLTDPQFLTSPGSASSSALPTSLPLNDVPVSSGSATQAATGAALITPASSPSATSSVSPSSGGTSPSSGGTSPNAGSASSSSGGTSFLQNKSAIIGISTTGSLLIVIFLIYVFTRFVRARRRRQFDREMDESFQEAMDKASAGWRRSPSPDYSANAAALERAPSALSTHSAASFGAYAQPPLAVSQQQYAYGGYVAHPEYASPEYWAAAQAGPHAITAHGPGMGAWMGQPQPQPQPPHAMPTYVQPGTGWVDPGLLREPPAAIPLHPEPQAPPRDYLSNYTTPPPAGDPGYGSPGSPVLLNPFDSNEERALKVANE